MTIEALRKAIGEKAGRMNAIIEAAKADSDRSFSDSERAELEQLVKDGTELRGKLDAALNDLELTKAAGSFADLGGAKDGGGADVDPARKDAAMQTLGAAFAESDGYKALRKRGFAGEFSSGAVDTGMTTPEASAKTLLTEQAGSGANLLQPTVQAGILPLLFRPVTIADLLPTGTLDGNLLRYLAETTFTNAAAAVAEAGTKPESALVFTQTDEPIQKIAHVLPVTDETLEDVAGIRSYIDARLTLGIQLTEEDQILNGSGSGANLRGILNRSGLATAVPRGTDSNADAIFKQVTAIRTTAFITPDAIVMNPANWQTIMLDKDANGTYRAGGPFAPTTFGIGGGASLWGLRVVVTSAIAAGTALVGAFRGAAQLFRKGGISIEASNSHSTFFVENKTMIRAEERLGLAVYRPAGFGTVTGLN